MDYEKCKTNFQEYINTNYGAIEQCIQIFKDKVSEKEDVYEDLYNGHCIKITNKKEKFYNKTYDVRPILENFKLVLGEDNTLYRNFVDCCNAEVLDRCCNCVSVVLYLANCQNIFSLSRFIFTIEQSILNLEKFLPDWVYRLYMDPSVFESLFYIKTLIDSSIDDDKIKYSKLYDTYLSTIKNIASRQNCEIYLSYCSTYTEDVKNNLGKRRNYRFSGFYDLDVNINASREADGLIEFIDCYNLQVLETQPCASLLYVFGSVAGSTYFDTCGYGDSKDLIFSLSAGLIALKFKFKLDYYESAREKVLENYKINKNKNFQAVDECLLIELFKNFSYNPEKNDIKSYNIMKLFGILPLFNNDKKYSGQDYYIDIDWNVVNKCTNNLFESIADNAFILQKILEHTIYKNDIIMQVICEYSEELSKLENIGKFVYDKIFFVKTLSIVYLYSNNKIHEYIKKIKSEHPNKFIKDSVMYDILNITTNTYQLIFDGEQKIYGRTTNIFDRTLVNIFKNAMKQYRENIRPVSESSSKYYNKYLKYKSKYLLLKKN